MKKTLLFLLISGMLFAATPIFAQFSNGDGSENNPYVITTAAQLEQLATYVNDGNTAYNDKHYKLGNDLDVSNVEWWRPIGNETKSFKGFFDGNNKTIKVANMTGLYSGLFGYVQNGIIRNLGVCITDDYNSQLYQGGVVGYNDGGTISNCYSTGLVEAGGMSSVTAGGIVGYNKGGNVLNCYSAATVTSNGFNGCAGGVVGYNNNGSISNCYSTGSVYSSSYTVASYAGGIVGYNNGGSVSNCASLNVKLECTSPDYEYFGRVVGKNDSGTLSNNIAFDKMINPNGGTTWSNIGSSNIDGENITVQTINEDGTLGGLFTATNGWTTQNHKLPGLFGKTVDMPEHLRVQGFPYITTNDLLNGAVGTAYNQVLAAAGNTPTWSLESGNLPNGLTFMPSGTILGVPSTAGIYKFTVAASNSVGIDTKEFILLIINPGYPLILTESLPNGEIGEIYQQTLEVMSDTPVSWSLESGSLPTGLALSSAGTIIGAPTENGLYKFTVKATNALGVDTKALSINIGNVGISNHIINKTKIYPNPTTGELTIDNGVLNLIQETIDNVEIFDIYGKMQNAECRMRNAEGKVVINISNLTAGTYFIKLGNETVKVVKQ